MGVAGRRSASRRAVDGASELGAGFEPVDYSRSFAAVVENGEGRSAEMWARGVFESAPTTARAFVLVGWRLILRLRLGPLSSVEHVLGWGIVSRSERSIALEASSTALSAYKLLVVSGDVSTLTTFVRYERWWAKGLWAAVLPVHTLTEPYLLRRGTRHPESAVLSGYSADER